MAGLARAGLLLLAGALLSGGSAMADATTAPLIGSWGGPQVQLTLGPDGGRIDYACAAGRIDGAVRPDARGRFAATGSHEAFTGGPTRADAPPALVPVRYDGQLDGTTLRLSVTPAGAAAQLYTLERGRRIKLLRCQ